ncbi:hypothetical protein SK128_020096, partial [Halocaridina rubra]
IPLASIEWMQEDVVVDTKTIPSQDGSGPLSVTIVPVQIPIVAGRRTDMECTVIGSHPPPIVTWFLDSEQVGPKHTSAKVHENITVSTLALDITRRHHGNQIVCRAEHPTLTTSILEDIFTLVVLCKYYSPGHLLMTMVAFAKTKDLARRHRPSPIVEERVRDVKYSLCIYLPQSANVSYGVLVRKLHPEPKEVAPWHCMVFLSNYSSPTHFVFTSRKVRMSLTVFW